jgi:hypothetical protein
MSKTHFGLTKEQTIGVVIVCLLLLLVLCLFVCFCAFEALGLNYLLWYAFGEVGFPVQVGFIFFFCLNIYLLTRRL